MTRSKFLAAAFALVIVVSVSGPALAAGGVEGLTPSTSAADSGYSPFSFTPPDDAVTHGSDNTPSWIVDVENGSLSTLSDWANASDERRIHYQDNTSTWAVVEAPAGDVGATRFARLLGATLVERDYVNWIELNRVRSYAEPVSNPVNTSALDTPGGSFDAFSAQLGGDANYGEAGIADDETAEEHTIGQARNLTGSDRTNGTGAGYTLAVIDSGTNTCGGCLFSNGPASATNASRILNASKDMLENETVGDDGIDAIEDTGTNHGTWVASSAVANHTNDDLDGYAPDADLLAIRALDTEGKGSTATIARSIRYAADNGADIIVMSLGSPVYSHAIRDAIDYAYAQDVTAVVIAAGNSRMQPGGPYLNTPADVPEPGTIAVTATNYSQNASGVAVTYFANVGPDNGAADASAGATRGQTVTVGAPGFKTTARVVTASGSTTNATLSGTSMAAPQVGGAGLQVLEERPELEGEERAFEENLTDSARPAPMAASAEIGSGVLAVDNFNESIDPSSQEAEMTDGAYARDLFWKRLSGSDGEGGWNWSPLTTGQVVAE